MRNRRYLVAVPNGKPVAVTGHAFVRSGGVLAISDGDGWTWLFAPGQWLIAERCGR